MKRSSHFSRRLYEFCELALLGRLRHVARLERTWAGRHVCFGEVLGLGGFGEVLGWGLAAFWDLCHSLLAVQLLVKTRALLLNHQGCSGESSHRALEDHLGSLQGLHGTLRDDFGLGPPWRRAWVLKKIPARQGLRKSAFASARPSAAKRLPWGINSFEYLFSN